MARPTQRDPIPEYCGFRCPYGEFPPADTSGLCRTMAAVYCRKLRRLVEKNRPCHWRAARQTRRRRPRGR